MDQYCVSDDRISVNVIPLPGNANIGKDTILCLNEVLEVDATASSDPLYLWENGATDPLRTFNHAGHYTISISNECGENTFSFDIGYEDCRQVFSPNAFSPNEDGFNDVFLPFDGSDVAQVAYFKIFDRWGGLVFENSGFQPNDFSAGWDGTAKGRKANPGVYAWMAEVIFRDGFVERLEGDVALVR